MGKSGVVVNNIRPRDHFIITLIISDQKISKLVQIEMKISIKPVTCAIY